jgi:Fe-S oxidoreductase
MSRPDLRPMHRLPVLEARRTALETCVFCPKLCRSACPVSNAEATETLTPWGKMSTAYFVARGDVPASESFARTSLACTGCYACRELCDHENDVAGTLLTARAGEAALGILPESARKVGRTFPKHQERARDAVRALAAHPAVRDGAQTGLLIGCTYARGALPEARAAIVAATGILREPVTLVDECCGLPLLHAGEATLFTRQAESMAEAVARFARVVVVDAGCAAALRLRYAEVGTHLRPKVELLVELAANDLARLTPVRDVPPVRYHDPCQLGRGLGVYEAPRRVLARATGRAPREFVAQGRHAACSGAGGLLPVTMPDTARRIAAARQDEHVACGGGEIVTACASSLLQLRKAGPAPVSDLVSWIARAVQPFLP